MTKQKPGLAIIIVAPSGAGKSTLINKLKNQFSVIKESISHTTRSIRPGETDGCNYYFISVDQFKEMIENQDFIEWAQVHGQYYGTSLEFIKAGLDRGDIILLDIDVQGADAMKKALPGQVVTIFIKPPSLEALRERLIKRGTDSQEVIELRLSNAVNELKRSEDYDYCVLNDQLENAFEQLKTIFSQLLLRT